MRLIINGHAVACPVECELAIGNAVGPWDETRAAEHGRRGKKFGDGLVVEESVQLSRIASGAQGKLVDGATDLRQQRDVFSSRCASRKKCIFQKGA